MLLISGPLKALITTLLIFWATCCLAQDPNPALTKIVTELAAAGNRADEVAKQLDEISKPYTKGRPKYGENQVDIVFKNAKQPNGNVYDPNTGELITWDKNKPRNGQWDMGHVPGMEYRKYHKDYMDDKITKEEFLKIHRNPKNYRPELLGPNRSHKYEQK